ncbi:MAG: DUF480 domain-containing protein, partial [Phycisphaerae bacterium]|nr:DUF480 domain-containing protein [Phycisphaerae bacterium]
AAKGLVEQAPRLPGQKEQRYYHLLAPVDVVSLHASEAPASCAASGPDRVAELEQKVASLSQELTELKQLFGEFKQQFD